MHKSVIIYYILGIYICNYGRYSTIRKILDLLLSLRSFFDPLVRIYIWFHRFSFLLRRRHIGRYFVWTVYCYVIHDRYKYINGFASIAFTTFFCTNRNIPMRILQYKSFGNDVSHHALLYKLTFIVRAQCTYYKLSREFTNIYRYTVKQS